MKLLTKLAFLVLFIIVCYCAFKIGADMQYNRLENKLQMCIDR